MKFKKKITSRIKQFREELELPQLELAKLVGVSRQTIYYLERGSYNPSLTISFKISEILKKPIHDIFYQEPVIKDILEGKSLAELREVAEIAGINLEKLASLSEIDDEHLTKDFKEDTLIKIALGLGIDFEDLFEKEAEN
ncbi:MAG: helix-turn-helix domain-containing protein [Candidatus Lokiarchaeota archaeon]|nr:helix-turn-helix domain-containing protein [Candidatus Lokiarchaeota archaeon]